MGAPKNPTSRFRRVRLFVAALAIAVTGVAASTQSSAEVETEEAWGFVTKVDDRSDHMNQSSFWSFRGGAWG